jgi:hypothetical protein
MSLPTSDRFPDALKAIKNRKLDKWLPKKPSQEDFMVLYQLSIEPKFSTDKEAVYVIDELLSRGFEPEKQMGAVRKGTQSSEPIPLVAGWSTYQALNLAVVTAQRGNTNRNVIVTCCRSAQCLFHVQTEDYAVIKVCACVLKKALQVATNIRQPAASILVQY